MTRALLLLAVAFVAVARPAAAEEVDPDRFEKEVLVPACTDPMGLDVLPDGRVLFIERPGTLKLYRPADRRTVTLGTVPTASFGEVGMLGLAADRQFPRTGWVYLFFCPAAQKDTMRLSRFTVAGDKLDLASEKKLLDYKIDVEGPIHMGGGLVMDAAGHLYVGCGDNCPPIPEVPIDQRPGKEISDAFRTAGNSRDLRGSVLRIRPEPDGTYTTPKDNLFPDGKDGRPEIFAMGCRNPFRLAVDPKSGCLYFGDVGPNIAPALNLGPEGYDEVNQAPKAGNFGWPMFTGPNEAFRRYDFATKEVGPAWDVNDPVNPSRNNTGLKRLPPPLPALLWYPTGPSKQFPELGSGGRSAMVGPVYHADPASKSAVQLPAAYDRTLFVYDWMRNWIKAVKLDEGQKIKAIEPFLPGMSLRKPIDLKTGPDGALYLLEFGDKWGENHDAQLVRIVYRRGNRPPVAVIEALATAGKHPLTVPLYGRMSFDKDGDALKYAWRVDGGVVEDGDRPRATVRFDRPGTYTVRLTVTDRHGASGTAETTVQAGNALPRVQFTEPRPGGFFDWGQPIEYQVAVADDEDGAGVAPERVTVQAAYVLRRDGPGDEPPHPGLGLMKKSTCFACHAAGDQSKGPPYALVAQKYKDDKNAHERLAQKVLTGGAGAWGAYPMPPHPQHTPEQARHMVDWVLSLAAGHAVPPTPGPAGGFTALADPGAMTDHGSYVLTARYTDGGAPGAAPLTGETTRVLHARKRKAAFADVRHGVQVVHELEGKDVTAEGMVARFGPGDHVAFKTLDLAGIDRVRVFAGSLEGAAGAFELRAGGPDGPVVATVHVPATPGYRTVTVPLKAGRLTDLYVVARTPEARKALSLIWLEFLDSPEAAAARAAAVAAAQKRAAARQAAFQARPVVRPWKVADLAPHLGDLDRGRSFARGKELFRAAACSSCHRLGKDGADIGPDLTDVAKRLAKGPQPRAALLREVLEPSAVIDAKYRPLVVTMLDGRTLVGTLVDEDAKALRLATDPRLAPDARLVVPRDAIDEVAKSNVSLMPPGLVDTLSRDEVLDLLAYLETGADPQAPAFQAKAEKTPELVSVAKIWDRGRHNAFTDLIRWRDKFYCVFREGEAHVGGDGKLRVLASAGGDTWEPAALLTEADVDLRDPHLSVTPDDRLMIVAGGSVYEGTKLLGMQPRVAFSADGTTWTAPRRVLAEGDWLWRVTWHAGKAYGVAYRTDAKDGSATLYASRDGLAYERVARLDVPGRPNEVTLRVLPDGAMMAMVRREGGDAKGWLGTSPAPYREWTWHATEHRFGGPNFLVLPGGALWASSRRHAGGTKTEIARLTRTSYDPALALPSGGDTSYAGLVWHDRLLWVSYYASHEGRSSIYLAKVRLPD